MTLKPSLLRFKFDYFANLPHEHGDSTCADAEDESGIPWKLQMYICGSGGEDNTDNARMEFYVYMMAEEADIDATIAIIVRDAAGKVFIIDQMMTRVRQNYNADIAQLQNGLQNYTLRIPT